MIFILSSSIIFSKNYDPIPSESTQFRTELDQQISEKNTELTNNAEFQWPSHHKTNDDGSMTIYIPFVSMEIRYIKRIKRGNRRISYTKECSCCF